MSVADEPFAQDGAGEPDGLQRLWMPHRMAYIKGENRAADGPEECPFCRAPKLSDADGLIVARGMLVYAVLNLYAQGFNIGMNMGGVAGAGIAAHLHQHVVPRWGGDTNFMPVVGHTKVLPQLLSQTREMIAAAWPTPVSGVGQAPEQP